MTNVAMLPAHAEAETALRHLNARRLELQSVVANNLQRRHVTPAVKQAARDLTSVEAEIADTRSALLPLRAAHAEAVKQAHAEPLRDAARRALLALDEAETCVAEINAMRLAIRAVGGEAANVPAEKLLVPVRQLLRPIAGKP